MASKLPYRIRVPLQAIKKRSRPPSESALISEETWTAAATPNYLQHILTSKVYDVAQETPLQLMTGMSKRLQNKIYLKREDMQPGFSFKVRGAYNKLAHLTEKEKQKGVVTFGTSNQAWSATLAASKLGVSLAVVMPAHTPLSTRTLLSELGAELITCGTTLEDAMVQAMQIQADTGKVFLSPYDDPLVIAGQGTIGLEIINQLGRENLDAIFCCVGGGGLLSGVAAYVKGVCPNVRVIGVEAQGSEAMTLSLEQGQRVELPRVSTFAECAAVTQVGEECFRLCNELVDDMVVVTNDELCAAIENTFEETRSMLEPAGALALAGAKKYITEHDLEERSFVAITSGANVKFDRLRFVADRALIGQQKEALLSVVIPEEPGSFQKLYSMVYPRAVTELSYRFSPSAEGATIFLAFEVNKPGSDEVSVLVEQLQMAGMVAMDLTTDELAKAHARYMSGGRANQDPSERVYRFEFPETPGALKKFLDCLPDDLDITLFHYRSHGADKGKVLAGMRVPADQESDFEAFLTSLNYPYKDETENPVFKKHIF